MFYAAASAVTVPNFAKHDSEKGYLDRIEMEEQFSKLAEAGDQKKIKVAKGIPEKRMDFFQSSCQPTDISHENKPTRRGIAVSSDL